MKEFISIELPWPPSTNTFLRHFLLPGRKHPSTCISEKGREFYAAVARILYAGRYAKMSGALSMTIDLYPPDKRRTDVDNRNKPVLDSLKRRPKDKKQLPGSWIFADDDSQVRKLTTELHPCIPGAGKAIVTISTIPGSEVQTGMFTDEDTD
jgi:crossover junction endodeoxyribonuclease RusA